MEFFSTYVKVTDTEFAAGVEPLICQLHWHLFFSFVFGKCNKKFIAPEILICVKKKKKKRVQGQTGGANFNGTLASMLARLAQKLK